VEVVCHWLTSVKIHGLGSVCSMDFWSINSSTTRPNELLWKAPTGQ
jgi:hypothetical protein